MELSDLKKLELRPVDADFNGLNIVVNVNAVTGRHFRYAAEQMRVVDEAQKAEEKRQAQLLEQRAALQCEIDNLKAQHEEESNGAAKELLLEQMASIQKEIDALLPSTLEIFEGRGKETEAVCELYASLIKGSEESPLLMSWDLTHEGQPVPCTVEELKKRHPQLLIDLYNACVRVDRPKLQETRTTATSRTTSDSTVASTPTPDTRTDAAPIM